MEPNNYGYGHYAPAGSRNFTAGDNNSYDNTFRNDNTRNCAPRGYDTVDYEASRYTAGTYPDGGYPSYNHISGNYDAGNYSADNYAYGKYNNVDLTPHEGTSRNHSVGNHVPRSYDTGGYYSHQDTYNAYDVGNNAAGNYKKGGYSSRNNTSGDYGASNNAYGDYSNAGPSSRNHSPPNDSAGNYVPGNYNSGDYTSGNHISGKIASGSYNAGNYTCNRYATGDNHTVNYANGNYNTDDYISTEISSNEPTSTDNFPSDFIPADHIRFTTRAILIHGNDLRIWPGPARRDLTLGGSVDILSSAGTYVCTAYKLALVVLSPMFRAYFEGTPAATSVEVADPNIEPSAIIHVMQWVRIIVDTPSATFGIKVPNNYEHVIKVRYAAVKLGMELYVRHFVRMYKQHLRDRMPSSAECETLERLSLDDVDDMVSAAGERLAYMRRRKFLDWYEMAALREFLGRNERMARAVDKADERTYHARRQQKWKGEVWEG